MSNPALTIFFVTDIQQSVTFYRAIKAADVIEQSPTFALLQFHSGGMLAFWSKQSVQPPLQCGMACAELAWRVDSVASLHQTYQQWEQLGVTLLQRPVQMEFGLTFLACDPDGYRLRVFVG